MVLCLAAFYPQHLPPTSLLWYFQFAGKSSMNIGAKKIPAMLRMKLWLGLEGDSEQFQLGMTDASIAVFAETVRLLNKKNNKK